MMKHERLFLGLQPDPHTALAIDLWRVRNYPALMRPVAVQNLHVTVSFLGTVDSHRLDIMCQHLDNEPLPKISLTLDEVGYWPRQSVFFLTTSETPNALLSLQRICTQAIRTARIKTDHRKFQPHMTLARKVDPGPAAPLTEPAFVVDVPALLLIASTLRPQGPVYTVIEHWPLV